MDFLDDLFNVGNGIRSGIEDVPSLIGNVLTGDVHGVVTDGRKLIGDVGDVLGGIGGLGVSVGKVSARYAGTVGKLADSPILSAAQLVIEGEKATTGSGDPEDGNGYQQSSKRLEACVEVLISAEPHDDRWDGNASAAYKDANDAHRRRTSKTQVADSAIGAILATEADQVSRTRQTLDDTSQYLYDYGLATAVINLIPGAVAAKLAADAVVAAGALATTNATMAILVKNSLENAARVREQLGLYDLVIADAAAGPTDLGPDVPFIDPTEDQASLPTRVQSGAIVDPPLSEVPIDWGHPAIPLGDPPQPPP